MDIQRCVVAFLISMVVLDVGISQTVLSLPDISDSCIGCICDASSGCNETIGCINGYCGPYLISKPYWLDAKSQGVPPPTINGEVNTDDLAYEHCTQDLKCAAETIRRYTKRFGQDCDANGIIDCNDFTMIHKNGGYNCKIPLNPAASLYYYQFLICASKHNELGLEVSQDVLSNPPSIIGQSSNKPLND